MRGKTQEMLFSVGRHINEFAEGEVQLHLSTLSEFNPWHVCFAIGLSWGHLAKFNIDFTAAAASTLKNWNDADLGSAKSFHLERGTEPIEKSLIGAHNLFSRTVLPEKLPNDLDGYHRVQERWLGKILGPERPPYIGSWNATAITFIALFSQKSLWRSLKTPIVMMPPGGPIFNALNILFQSGLLSRKPSGSELDDGGFEPGVIYENNALMEEILKGTNDWNLADVHTGLYMLGTRDRNSNWLGK